jgi:hypothetical protein
MPAGSRSVEDVNPGSEVVEFRTRRGDPGLTMPHEADRRR